MSLIIFYFRLSIFLCPFTLFSTFIGKLYGLLLIVSPLILNISLSIRVSPLFGFIPALPVISFNALFFIISTINSVFNASFVFYAFLPFSALYSRVWYTIDLARSCRLITSFSFYALPFLALFCDRSQISLVPESLRIVGGSHLSLYTVSITYLYLFVNRGRFNSFYHLLSFISILFFSFLFINSRQLLLVILIPPFIVLCFAFFRGLLAYRLKVNSFLLLIIVLLLLLVLIPLATRFLPGIIGNYEFQKYVELSELSFSSNSDLTRISLFNVAYDSILGNLWFGTGASSAMNLGRLATTRLVDGLSLHNSFLTSLAEFGIVGTLSFLLALACAFLPTRNKSDYLSHLLASFVFSLVLIACFQDIVSKPSFVFAVLIVPSVFFSSSHFSRE